MLTEQEPLTRSRPGGSGGRHWLKADFSLYSSLCSSSPSFSSPVRTASSKAPAFSERKFSKKKEREDKGLRLPSKEAPPVEYLW